MAESTANIIYDPPIEVDLGDNGGAVHFEGDAESGPWLAVENQFWEEIEDFLFEKGIPTKFKQAFKSASLNRDILLPSVLLTDSDAIEKILTHYKLRHIYHSRSAAADLIKNSSLKSDHTTSILLYIAAFSGVIGIESEGEQLDVSSLILAHLRLFRLSLGTQNDLRTQYAESISQLEKLLDEIEQNARQKLNSINNVNVTLHGNIEKLTDLENRVSRLGADVALEINSAVTPQKDRIDTILNQIEVDAATAKTKVSTLSEILEEKLRENLSKLQDEATARLDSIAKSAEDRLDVKNTINFWKAKRFRHGWFAVGSFTFFFVM
jgi:hypothetical protein